MNVCYNVYILYSALFQPSGVTDDAHDPDHDPVILRLVHGRDPWSVIRDMKDHGVIRDP